MTMTSVLPGATHVGAITLLARDLPTLSAFYGQLLGLTPTQQHAHEVVLSAHGTPLLHVKASR